MLRLEGNVRGKPVLRDCATAELATCTVAILLDPCAIAELRLLAILKTFHAAALDGRSCAWSSPEFVLMLSSQQDGNT